MLAICLPCALNVFLLFCHTLAVKRREHLFAVTTQVQLLEDMSAAGAAAR